MVEHLQGTRHLIRFADHDKSYRPLNLFSGAPPTKSKNLKQRRFQDSGLTVPLSLCTSTRALKNCAYTENEVGYLFQYAETEAEKTLANVLRDSVYQTTIEYLNGANPVIDRKEEKPDQVVSDLTSEVWRDNVSIEARLEKVRTIIKLQLQKRGELTNRVRSEMKEAALSGIDKWSTLFDVETKHRLMCLYHRAIEVGYEPEPEVALGMLSSLPSELQPFQDVRFHS